MELVEKLKPCRACGKPCSIQRFEGEHIEGVMTVYLCSNSTKLGGNCPDPLAYLNVNAWNTRPSSIVPSSEVVPDWLNAETCIENADIAYDDSLCDDDGPVDTVISSGDLGVLIGLAKYALANRAALEAIGSSTVEDGYKTSGETPSQPRPSTTLDMCSHGADRGTYCGYCGGYSKGARA